MRSYRLFGDVAAIVAAIFLLQLKYKEKDR